MEQCTLEMRAKQVPKRPRQRHHLNKIVSLLKILQMLNYVVRNFNLKPCTYTHSGGYILNCVCVCVSVNLFIGCINLFSKRYINN